MTSDQLSLTLTALADPTRRAILARLGRGEATVMELAAPFDLKLPTVSKHLKVLQRAGLVTQGRRAQWRPCRLETAPLKEVDAWVELVPLIKNFRILNRAFGFCLVPTIGPAGAGHLVERCRSLADGPVAAYVPTVRGGGKMHVRMLCLGRHWNGQTYRYEPTRTDFDGLVTG